MKNDFEKIYCEFLNTTCQGPLNIPTVEYWDKHVKNNKELLEWALVLKSNNWGDVYPQGILICEYMLKDSKSVDPELYNKLINMIYSSKDIARIPVNNSKDSFLLISLINSNLKLTEEQKAFAVDEAMHDYDTVLYAQEKENCKVVCCHGKTVWDIKYWILRSSNWSKEEKAKLIQDFWAEDTSYTEALTEWETDIFYEFEIKNHYKFAFDFNQGMMYDYSYGYYLDLFGYDKKVTDEAWEEIQFCKLMNELRPKKYEEDMGRVRDE